MESRKRVKLDEAAVKEKFSCIVCDELPPAEVLQCINGHIMCHECYENPLLNNKCPCCRSEFPPPANRIRNLVVEQFLDKVIKVECSFKDNGCEFEGDRGQGEIHRATCFYNFEKYGQLVNLCQKMGYASCNFQLNNGNTTAAIDHFQSQHGFQLAESQTFELTLEDFKRAIGIYSPHRWTPIIAKLLEDQGHVLLLPIINQNEDFSCLSVWLPDPDYYSSLLQIEPIIQVELELPESENSEYCNARFVDETKSLEEIMKDSLETLSRSIRGSFLKDHMRNKEKMTLLCNIKGNVSSTCENDAKLEQVYCKLSSPFQKPETGKTEKALKWLKEEEAKAKVDRNNLWEFLFNLFDNPTKLDRYSYQEIGYVKYRAVDLVLRHGTAAQLSFLKGNGSALNRKFQSSGCSSLHYVLKNDNDTKIALEKIKILVDSGVDFNRLTNSGGSVLHYASLYSSIETVKYCLEELRLDTNVVNVNGANALHLAVQNKNEDWILEIAELLLDYGADPQMKKTKDGIYMEFANPIHKEKLEEILRLHQAKKPRKQFMCSLLSERF